MKECWRVSVRVDKKKVVVRKVTILSYLVMSCHVLFSQHTFYSGCADQSIDVHLASLPDPMGAVYRGMVNGKVRGGVRMGGLEGGIGG